MGVNIEASLRLRLDRDAPLYSEAVNFLESVHTRCVAFDPNAVDYYKWLQGAALEEPIWVLELSGARALLDQSRKFTLFGRSDEDYRNLKSVDKSIVVSLLDIQGSGELLYEATVSDTGHLAGAGVDFDARVYAAQNGPGRPWLAGPSIPPPGVLGSARSWATIGILEELRGTTFELPPAERWLVERQDESVERHPGDLKDWFPDPHRPLIKRAVPREEFQRKGPEAETAAISHELVESRQSLPGRQLTLPGPRLLRKKVVRAKRSSGASFGVGRRRPRDEREEE
jgi:hypothetical protein